MSVTPNQTFGQAILALIESDLATIGGSTVVTLLTDLQASAGNIVAQQAAILKFVATAPQMGIQLEVQIEAQLLQLAISKIQGFIASKAAK